MKRIEMDNYQQAMAEERNENFHAALKLFEDCLSRNDLDKGDVLFHCAWCQEHNEAGDKEEATRLYFEASRIAHSNACRLNSMFRAGWLLMHAKEYSQAATMFRHAIDYGDVVDLKIEPYQQAAYWYAVCLETEGQFLEALQWYRLVEGLAPQLRPESHWRQVHCLESVGSYGDAVEVCNRLAKPAPDGFPVSRYNMLRDLAVRERQLLSESLSDPFDPRSQRKMAS